MDKEKKGKTLADLNFIRTPSAAYREGTKEAIERVLDQVETQAEKRVKDGFSEFNFTVGVLNCFVAMLVFLAYPQHFWLLYLIEASFLFPFKVYLLMTAKPLNQIMYLLDFCWIMNFAGVIGFVALALLKEHLSDYFRKQLFLGAYGTACGPLTGATAVLPFVALIFHHRDTMTSFFIHFFPPLLFYVMKWHSAEVQEAWPTVFNIDYEIEFWPNGSFIDCVFGNTLIFYLIWFIPYCLWQLYIGIDLPRTHRHKKLADGVTPASAKYDTVFHSILRDGICVTIGTKLFNRAKEDSIKQMMTNDFEVRDFLAYIGAHFICSIGSIAVLAYPCYVSKYVHATFLWALFAVCTYRGSRRYTYYSTKMYGRIIRKHFADEINPQAVSDIETDVDTNEITPLQRESESMSRTNEYQSMR